MLREAIDAMTMPTRNPCKWSDAVISSGEGASVRDDTKDVGVETHDGGPSVSEYPDRTLLLLGSVCSWAEADVVLSIGESVLLEKVSGMT